MSTVHASRWLVQDETGNFLIEFQGTTQGSQARVSINGQADTYILSPVEEKGYFAALPCGKRECFLQLSPDLATTTLYVDGTVQTPLESAPEIVMPAPDPLAATFAGLQKKVKSGMGSFLTLIILSLVNLVLILVNATISFPFSIFTAIAAMSFGSAFADEAGNSTFLIVGIIVAILIIAAYGALYLLARRRTWAAWVAFGLIVCDSLLLAGFAVITQDLAGFAIDLLFHVWILWSVFNLCQARSKLDRLTREQLEKQSALTADSSAALPAP